MPEKMRWIPRLEAEIARELGQPLTLTVGGEPPGQARRETIETPEARLTLAANSEQISGLLVEARVIEAGQADAAMVQELWTGILSSVAARLGGRLGEPGPDSAPEPDWEPCSLRLGQAVVQLALDVEEREGEEREGEEREARRERPAERGNFDLLLEVELDASVRFGSREMELKELLELGPGDVVELDRHVADPVDLVVGDKIVARGEVVLVNGNFGLRVTEVAEPVRRLESIRCFV